MVDDKKKGVGTMPVRVGETAARYINIAALILIYVVIVYLVFVPRYFTPIMLIVFLAWKPLLRAINVISQPHPTKAPEGYLPGLLIFRRFVLSIIAGLVVLFILGLIVDTLLRLFVTGFWPLR